jgi:tRNA A-37 threonylcarbamoyl transferase component Bud32
MSQMTWTYIDDAGRRHRIGLFHGDTNRHLLVYCEDRVLIIDFAVTTDKHYSFYIDDELMDIRVEEKDGRFSYGLSVDTVTDTPRNRLRRETGRRQAVLLVLLALGLILVVAAAVIWLMR